MCSTRTSGCILFGKLELTSHGMQMQSPQYEILQRTRSTRTTEPDDRRLLHTGRIVPVYEKTGSYRQSAAYPRASGAAAAAANVVDPLPAEVRARELIDRRTALLDVHFPPAGTPIDELNAFRSPAHRRLIFEEFFLFQLGLVLRRRRADAERKPRPVVVTDAIARGRAARAAVQADAAIRRP